MTQSNTLLEKVLFTSNYLVLLEIMYGLLEMKFTVNELTFRVNDSK